MDGPTTYAAWATLLDRFAEGDNAPLEELSRGRFELDAGTATRFYNRVDEAYKARKKMWLNKFNRSFQAQPIQSVDDFGIMLRNAKQTMTPIIQFAALPGLPENLRSIFKKDLNDFFADIQKSLKDGASKAPRERDQMLILLRTFTLDGISAEAISSSNPPPAPGQQPTTGRRIIF